MPTERTAPERLDSILVSRQLASEAKVEAWKQIADRDGIAFEEVVIREQALSRAQILQILENHFFCPSIDLSDEKFPIDVLSRIPRQLAEHHDVMPVRKDGDRLIVAFADPSDSHSLDSISVAAHAQILPRVTLRCEIEAAIADHYAAIENDSPAAKAEAKAKRPPTRKSPRGNFRVDVAGKSPVEIVDTVLGAAVQQGATDVHFNPAEDGLVVRFRIDGILQKVAEVPEEKKTPVVARMKVTSNLDIAEHRVPQDGRHTIEHGDDAVDLRVSTLPSQFGENVVIRLLRKDTNLLQLDKLNMPPAIVDVHGEMVTSPAGFFLVTGPTGSGKTTTLYATLSELDREEQNIITLEDPIEYTLPGITQVHIAEQAGLTFAAGLRSILRQDPDVVLVGEIRDLETVEIACRAALTGHKVLSTLHTNDACQAVTRLLDMGLPPHLLTATLRGVLAQRLVRVICENCKETYAPTETELAILGYPKITELHHGVGCDACSGMGYKGRMALFEYFNVDENLHRLILDRASPYAIRHAAQRGGMILMGEFAKKAVLQGKTTVAEIQRVIFSSEGSEQLCGNCGRVVSADFVVCPFCQHHLKERCEGCGSAVEGDWEACPNCGREQDREWQRVFCRNCLAPVDAGWKTCNYCGEAIS